MKMKLYRHKDLGEDTPPVSAVQIQQDTYAKAAIWCNGRVIKELIDADGDEWQMGINVPAMGGMDRASETDYVVRDMAGAFHVMTQHEFESHFEEVGASKAPAPRGLKPRR